MSKLALETIHSDAIFEILSCFTDFYDFHCLLPSSPVYFRVFKDSSTTILTRVTKNILGNHAWKHATTIMIYERHTNDHDIISYLDVKEDLSRDFVLQQTDIPQLFSSYHFFEDCLKTYAELTALPNLRYPRRQASSNMTMSSKFTDLIGSAQWRTEALEWVNPFWYDMFIVFGGGYYQFVYLKAMSHFAAATAKSNPKRDFKEFGLLKQKFQKDYAHMSLEAVVKKYELNFSSLEEKV